MSTMNISLPDSLKAFVEEKVQSGAYSTNSEFVKALLRKEQDRDNLRALLMQGISSGCSSHPIDEAYFQRLQDKVNARKTT